MSRQPSILPAYEEVLARYLGMIPKIAECCADDIERKGYSRYRFPPDASAELLRIGEGLWPFFDENDVRFAGQIVSMLMELGSSCSSSLGLTDSFEVLTYLFFPGPSESFSGLFPKQFGIDPYEAFFSDSAVVWQPIHFCLREKLKPEAKANTSRRTSRVEASRLGSLAPFQVLLAAKSGLLSQCPRSRRTKRGQP